MNHPPPMRSGQADSRWLLERLDRLESILRERQQALSARIDDLQCQLARFGLETAEQVSQACEQLETRQPGSRLPPAPAATAAVPSTRAVACRRVGRMV